MTRAKIIAAIAIFFALAGCAYSDSVNIIELGEGNFTTIGSPQITITGKKGSTLQNAVNIIPSGGTIIISGDFELENTLQIGKNVTIRSTGTSRIYGNQNFGLADLSGNITLENLCFEYGYETIGGGLYITGSGNITMKNCAVRGCGALYYGGGIFTSTAFTAVLDMTDCEIMGNFASDYGVYGYGWGGGMCIYGGTVFLRGCYIHENYAYSVGGGIVVNGKSYAAGDSACVFENNTAELYPQFSDVYDNSEGVSSSSLNEIDAQAGGSSGGCSVSGLRLVLLCVLAFMSGGCGGSSSSSVSEYAPKNANAAWSGSWIASSGTASARIQSTDHALDVQNIAAVFYSCDVEGDSGSAKMSALVILSGDMYMPMFFPDLLLSTDRTSLNSWTASTPHGTLSVNLLSDDKANLSGTVNYLGYDCSFSASVIRAEPPAASLKPENMLNGTWNYNAARAGGYRYANGSMSALIPRYVTMCFNGTDSTSSTATTAGFIEMPASASGSYNEEDSIYIRLADTENLCSITNIYGDIYAMAGTENPAGIVSLIFVQSETQIYVLMSWVQPDGQMCILLPMTKVQQSEERNIAAGLSRKWSAISGGGLMIPAADTSMQVSFELQSCDLSFGNIQASDGAGYAEISASGSFASASRTLNLNYDGLGISLEELGINLWRAVTDKGSRVYISMLSEAQALVVADIVYDGAEKCLLTAVFTPSE